MFGEPGLVGFLYIMVWAGKQTCSEKMIPKHTLSAVVLRAFSETPCQCLFEIFS